MSNKLLKILIMFSFFFFSFIIASQVIELQKIGKGTDITTSKKSFQIKHRYDTISQTVSSSFFGSGFIDGSPKFIAHSAVVGGAITHSKLGAQTEAQVAASNPTPQLFGAYNDVSLVGATATITSGSTALHVGSALFTAADVGKIIGVGGAGATQSTGIVGSVSLSTQGAACTSIPTVSLANPGGGYGSSVVALIAANAASVASGGSGYTASSTFSLTLDMGSGTAAIVSVSANASGVVVSVNSIQTAGSFIARSGLTAIATTGGTGSGATINLTSVNVPGLKVVSYGLSYPISGVTASLSSAGCSTAPVAGTPYVSPIVKTLAAIITAYNGPQDVTLSTAAGTTLTAKAVNVTYGHDDTVALTACFATKRCWLPSGNNYMAGDVSVPSGATVRGAAPITYANTVAGNPASFQTLSASSPALIAKPGSNYVLNVSGSVGARLSGLFIDCVDYQPDGISAGSNGLGLDTITVNRCFDGLGNHYGTGDSYSHGPTLTYTQFSNNNVGVSNFIDGVMLGGSLSANVDGAYMGDGAIANNFIGVRSEFNSHDGYSLYKSGTAQFVGGLIDRNGQAGAVLDHTTNVSFVSVQFRRNGANSDGNFIGNAHVVHSGDYKTVYDGVIDISGVDDSGAGPLTPAYDFVFNTGGNVPNSVTVVNSQLSGFVKGVSNGGTPTSYVQKDNTGGGDAFNNASRPFFGAGEAAQTLWAPTSQNMTPGQSSTLAMGQAPWTTNYSVFSRELIVTARDYNNNVTASARFNVAWYRTYNSVTATMSPAFGEVGIAGTITFGTSSKIQLAISNVAGDGSSFTLTATNGGAGDGSNWGVWAEMK